MAKGIGLLTAKEAATALRMSRSTFFRKLKAGEIVIEKKGRKYKASSVLKVLVKDEPI